MVVEDPVLGRHAVVEPLLVDLLATRAVRRLQGVHQAGAAYLVRSGRDASRHEHAVGVMLLLNRFGASLAEQAAGLIHDVSHTAFSHVADQVFDNRNESYHDQLFAELVLGSEIAAVFERHAIVLETVLDVHRWPLLERPLPDLCADRLDYTLRDLWHVGWINHDEIQSFLAALAVHDGQFVVTDLAAAVWFTEQYHRAVTELFMHPLELYANRRLADAIQAALHSRVLTSTDLLLEDTDVLDKLRAAGDATITRLLAGLRPGIGAIEDKARFDIHVFSKARYVDPSVLVDEDRVRKCSALQPSIKALHAEVQAKARDGVFVRILS